MEEWKGWLIFSARVWEKHHVSRLNTIMWWWLPDVMLSKSWSSIFREDIDITAKLLEAYLCFVKNTGEFIFGRCLHQRRGSATGGFAWSGLCMQDFQGIQSEVCEGLIVQLSFFPVTALYVLHYLQNKLQRTSKPWICSVWVFLGKRKWDCFQSNTVSGNRVWWWWWYQDFFNSGNTGEKSLLACWVLYDIIKDITTQNNCP